MFTSETQEIQKVASKRLADNLSKVIQAGKLTYRRQSSDYKKLVSKRAYVREFILLTYRGFYQEVKIELV